MIDRKAIKREVKKGIKNGTIKTYQDAEKIAQQYISENEASYETTIAISDLLIKKVDKVLYEKKYKHRWFKGKVTKIVYIDIWGRMWSRTKGVIKEGVKIRKSVVFGHCIDMLGGMMWSSTKGRTYICQYRTSEDELKNTTNPETFIG